jgi:hypothetical protein
MGLIFQKGGVTGKPQVIYLPILPANPLSPGGDEEPIVLQLVHLPDHIVAHAQIVQDFIQGIQARADSTQSGHRKLLLVESNFISRPFY